ncbi:MAG: hypothetical protein M3O61_14750, partial [Gemmatimonadota bacterium]|nr:hypothetical protein [Gemmatimonadota bacterium]
NNAQLVPPPTIPPDEVISDMKLDGPGGKVLPWSRPTFTQMAGLQLATGVGIVSAGVIITVLVFWVQHTPQLPDLSNASAVTGYKETSEAASKGALAIFDTIVVKALLPIFTSILGYIFGTVSAQQQTAAATAGTGSAGTTTSGKP